MYWYCNYSGDGHVSRDTDHCQIGNMVIWSMHWTQERGKKHCSPLCIYSCETLNYNYCNNNNH